MEVQARILAIRGNRDLASRAGVPDGEVDSLTAERSAQRGTALAKAS